MKNETSDCAAVYWSWAIKDGDWSRNDSNKAVTLSVVRKSGVQIASYQSQSDKKPRPSVSN